LSIGRNSRPSIETYRLLATVRVNHKEPILIHSVACFNGVGPKTIPREKRLDKHYGNLHSNNFIGCDSELFFLFQSGLRNLQTHASNDHPPHCFMNEGCSLLATRTHIVPPPLSSRCDSIGRHERQSH